MHQKCNKSVERLRSKCKKVHKQCIRNQWRFDLQKKTENNSSNTSSTAVLQAKGRPRPCTKVSMPTRPKLLPTRKETMSHTWVTWANIAMQILPMEKTHSLQLTLGHAQVKTTRHKSVTSNRNISQIKQLSQVKNTKEQIKHKTEPSYKE